MMRGGVRRGRAGAAGESEGSRVHDERTTTEHLRVETPESVAFAYELAGLGSRGLALALDSLAILAIGAGEAAIAGLVPGAMLLARFPTSSVLAVLPWVGGALVLAWFVTYWGYFIFGEVARNGRTWGKGRLGIRVVRDDGSRVSALDSVIRNLLRVVDVMPGTYAAGMLAVMLSRKNKRLGDMAAGTVVVRDAGEVPSGFDSVGVAENVALARDFLRRRGDLTEPARLQVGAAVLRTFGEEPGEDWDEATIAGRIAELCGAGEGAGWERA